MSLAEAHEAIGRPIGYTTIQTRLNRLARKALCIVRMLALQILRSRFARSGQCESSRCAGQSSGGGNVVPLVAQLISDRDLTKQEISDLKRLIQDAEKRNAR